MQSPYVDASALDEQNRVSHRSVQSRPRLETLMMRRINDPFDDPSRASRCVAHRMSRATMERRCRTYSTVSGAILSQKLFRWLAPRQRLRIRQTSLRQVILSSEVREAYLEDVRSGQVSPLVPLHPTGEMRPSSTGLLACRVRGYLKFTIHVRDNALSLVRERHDRTQSDR